MHNRNKRDYIIELYAHQLATIPFISSDGVEFHMVDAFICPICLRPFAIDSIDTLTLEHVPPASVGGKPILVTCKECNNNLGADIDVCLMNELEILHNINHLDIIPQKSKISFGGVEINAQTTYSNSSGFKFMISPQNNNPIDFESFLTEIKNAKDGYDFKLVVNITNRKRYINLANIALLKSAYLLAFYRLGYMYVLNANLDIVRNQILNPKKGILKKYPFIIADEKSIPSDLSQDVYYAKVNNIVCIVVILDLQYQKSNNKHKRAVILPHPKDSFCKVYSELPLDIISVTILNSVSPLPVSSVRVDEKISDLTIHC